MIYEVYGYLHKRAKKLLRRTSEPSYRMVSVDEEMLDGAAQISVPGAFFNEQQPGPHIFITSNVFPVENIVPRGAYKELRDSYVLKTKCREAQLGTTKEKATKLWESFIAHSSIPSRFRNAGLHYAGYIYEAESFCLPSWIWTNAALVRMYCRTGRVTQAKELCDLLIAQQQECGGWIVRNDYDSKGAIPVLAPNDSAYVANNACLECYIASGEKKYLVAAEKCADWIEQTARPDGMVYVGFDMKNQRWQTKHNIVDVGFTAGLFARLIEVTGDEKRKGFLKRFVSKYIGLFYNKAEHGFATSLNEKDCQIGGMFGRGQAWALEGLIPAYQVLREEGIKVIIEDTITMLINEQQNGAWAYNITRPLMGIDCKATPIIAHSLIAWNRICPEKALVDSATQALEWCIKHTATDGEAQGGIFSYCTEGAIVHSMYTNTAFVYSSAYAIELMEALG